MRIQKFIASSGVLSRRAAEEAILEGRVQLNGKTVTEMGVLVNPETDEVCVDGKKVQAIQNKRTFLFYKPRGVVTTKSDEKGRRSVIDFFKDIPSLNPVGRLDSESEGLLLMTHDGDLALKLTHPRYEVKKVYLVKVEPMKGFLPTSVKVKLSIDEALKNLTETGVQLEDGPGHFLSAKSLKEKDGMAEVEVTVNEGRNRFVRRMFEAVGFQVRELKRIQMGEYSLGGMKPGDRIELK